MVITLLRSYPSLHKEGDLKGTRKVDKQNNGITVFVYRVTGTDDELKEYERIQTEAKVNTIKDGNGHLWFTTQPVGLKGNLKISTNGKIFADTTAIDLASSMIKQYGELGREMARDIMKNGFVSEEAPESVKTPTGAGIDDLD